MATRQLSLPEELLLMLFNGESGYFHQVPGWDLNCAAVGAMLAELSLVSRIDTDMESMILLDRTEVGDPVLDPILKEIAEDPVQRNARYWIERLAPRAESIVDMTLNRLVRMKILEHHQGDFWTFSRPAGQAAAAAGNDEGTAVKFVTSRITNVILHNETPTPRDIIIVGLLNTCDVLRFMFQLDDASEARIKVICQLELIGRSIAEAVAHNLAGPLLRHSALTKKIPAVPLRKVLLNPHVRKGNIFIAQTATHYMSDVFPEPFKFDIDRYLPSRNEHHSAGYAPYGLGTHTCLGSWWLELQLAINVLMVAHYFTIEVAPADFKLRFNPLPSMKPSKKLQFRVSEQRREIRA